MRSIFTILAVVITTGLAQPRYHQSVSYPVAHGVTYSRYEVPAVPWVIDVMEIDLGDSTLDLMCIPSNDKVGDLVRETTSSMAHRISNDSLLTVGAVNGDFFSYSPGNTVGLQVTEGEIVKSHGGSHAMSFNVHKQPALNKPVFFGTVYASDKQHSLNGVNMLWQDIENWFSGLLNNRLMLYNQYFGRSTKTPQETREVLLLPLDPWTVNGDRIRCVVAGEIQDGNTVISPDHVVLSGFGNGAAFMETNINQGDTLYVENRLSVGLNQIKELIAGLPRIVVKGQPYVAQGLAEVGNPGIAPYDRNPRTAMGFSQDSTKLYLMTVDGRHVHSAGMTLPELADFMIHIGAAYVLNLDGGGSTTMVVQNKIMNRPSDGQERPVKNAFAVRTSNSPTGTLEHLQISPDNYRVFKGETLRFSATGWDDNFHRIEIDASKLVYESSADIGSIDQTGLYIAAQEPDTGLVIVSYEGLKDTATVIVKGIHSVSITPEQAVTDSFATLEFFAQAFDLDGARIYMDNHEFTWQVADPGVGVIDDQGKFRGLQQGTTQVILSYGTAADTATVIVQVGVGRQQLASFVESESWTLDGENIDLENTLLSIVDSPVTEGETAFKIDYQYTGDPQKINVIHLLTDIPIYGLPDSLLIDAKTDGNRHHVQYIFADIDDQLFRINTKAWADNDERLETLPARFADAAAVAGGTVTYPLTLKEIHIKLGGERTQGVQYQSTLYLDHLRVVYPGVETSVTSLGSQPQEFILLQNYPNPFNPETSIEYRLDHPQHIDLAIYNINGEKVVTLESRIKARGKHRNVWDGKNSSGAPVSSGIYLIRLQGKNFDQTIKATLVR